MRWRKKINFDPVVDISYSGDFALICGPTSDEEGKGACCWMFSREKSEQWTQSGSKYISARNIESQCNQCIRPGFGNSVHLVKDASAFDVGGLV